MFAAKLMILNKDREQVLADNPNADFLRNAFGMTANFRSRAKLGFGAEMPRVAVFSWDNSNVSDVELFKKFFDEFVAPEDYSFVMSVSDDDKRVVVSSTDDATCSLVKLPDNECRVREGGILRGVAEVRTVIGFNGRLVAGTTEKLSYLDMDGDYTEEN